MTQGERDGKKGRGKASVRDRMIRRQVYGEEGTAKKEKKSHCFSLLRLLHYSPSERGRKIFPWKTPVN